MVSKFELLLYGTMPFINGLKTVLKKNPGKHFDSTDFRKQWPTRLALHVKHSRFSAAGDCCVCKNSDAFAKRKQQNSKRGEGAIWFVKFVWRASVNDWRKLGLIPILGKGRKKVADHTSEQKTNVICLEKYERVEDWSRETTLARYHEGTRAINFFPF